MLLTGQVFTIMCNVADNDKIAKIVKATDKYLYNPNCGGYLLNNNFNELFNNKIENTEANYNDKKEDVKEIKQEENIEEEYKWW